MYDRVVDSEVNFLSFERACSLVPPEYLYAYEWFQDNESKTFAALPMGSHAPNLSVNIKLARQSGIHTPSYDGLDEKGAGK